MHESFLAESSSYFEMKELARQVRGHYRICRALFHKDALVASYRLFVELHGGCVPAGGGPGGKPSSGILNGGSTPPAG
jgi:hypothetical protein